MQMTNEFSQSGSPPDWKLGISQEEERSWNDVHFVLPPGRQQWTVHRPGPTSSTELGQCSYKCETDQLHDGYKLEGEFEGSTEMMESLVSGLLEDAQKGSHAAAAAAAASVSRCGQLSPDVLRMFQELTMQGHDHRNSTTHGSGVGGGEQEHCINDDLSEFLSTSAIQSNMLKTLYGHEGQLTSHYCHAVPSLSSHSALLANGNSFFAGSEQSSGTTPSGLMMRNAIDHAATAEIELLMMKEREFKAMIRGYAAEIQALKEREYLMMRNTREQAFAVSKENEELQKYKAIASELQPVAQRLLIERQTNAEVMKLCMEFYKQNCLLQEKIAASEMQKSGIMRMQQESLVPLGDDAAKLFGCNFEYSSPHPTLNTVSASPASGVFNRNISPALTSVSASQASGTVSNRNVAPGLTIAAPSTGKIQSMPFCRSNLTVPEKNPAAQYVRNQISPKQMPAQSKNRSSYTSRILPLVPDIEMPPKFFSANDPWTPKSVLSFPSTSSPSRLASNNNLVPGIDISGVHEESSTEVFGTPLPAKISAVLVQSPESNSKICSPGGDKSQTAEVLIPEGAKSISIRLKGEKSSSGGKKSNSFKGSSWHGGKSMADLRRARSLSPIRILDMTSLNDEGSTAIQLNIPLNDKKAAVELNVSNQGQLKTELCNNWVEKGNCPYGTYCRFAHGVDELRCVLRHPRYKTTPCRMIMDGLDCIYGHRCHFRHSLTDEEKSEMKMALNKERHVEGVTYLNQ